MNEGMGKGRLVDASAAYEGIRAIRNAKSGGEVTEGLKTASDALGFGASIFASFIKGDIAFDEYRFIANCPGTFCAAYQANRLHLNDPFLAYSQVNTGEVWGSKVPLLTAAEREAAEGIRQGGVASMLIIPAHSPNGVLRRGTLMLACSTAHEAEEDEGMAIQVIAIGQALAMSLHNWCVEEVRAEAMRKFALTEQDLILLQGTRERLGSKEMSAILETTPKAVDSKIQRVLDKMQISVRTRAADYAFQAGLIGSKSMREMLSMKAANTNGRDFK